jgi:diguanylate cyclase (GGDEF)-like protein
MEILFNYLRDVLYDPANAVLDIGELPEDFRVFGSGLLYFTQCVMETKALAQALSTGDLTEKLPSRGNEIAAPLKSLHASLKHLTWQTQQIAQGDYSQRVAFMGEFSDAFNMMVEQLAERQKKLEVRAYRDSVTQLYNRTYGMLTLDSLLQDKKQFVLIFADLDNLKYINDEFGHKEGDTYILNAAKYLSTFSPEAVVCRIGGDEFLLLVQNTKNDEALEKMNKIYENFQKDEYLIDKPYTYSVSFGIAVVETDNELSTSDILSIADERMYENKRMRKKERQK